MGLDLLQTVLKPVALSFEAPHCPWTMGRRPEVSYLCPFGSIVRWEIFPRAMGLFVLPYTFEVPIPRQWARGFPRATARLP